MDATKQDELLATIDREIAGWEALLAEIGEERMERPGAAGEWTFKDVVAHLNGWRRRTVARLEAVARGEAPPPPPWPSGLSDETDQGVDRINAWFYERDKDRPLADVLAESRDQFARLRAAVAALPERDLFEPGRFAWLGEHALGPAIIGGSSGHLHEEHMPAIRAWLAGLDGPQASTRLDGE